MNVYFCDVCGVRVTDLDLHSGHGMRRRNDVICAACLELGHGKGWVANHSQKQELAFAGAASAAGLQSRSGAADAATSGSESEPLAASAKHPTPVAALEMARDRLRTLDDDHPPEPVAPMRLEPAADFELSPAPPSLDDPPTTDDTAKVQVLHQELSTAAAGFAALSPPASRETDHPEDDLQEAPGDRLDDSGGAALLHDHAATPEQELDAEKAETASNAPVNEGTQVTAESRRKTSSSRTAPRSRTNTASSSSKVSKSSKSSKSRPVKRVKTGIPPIVLFSAVGLALILLIGIVVISSENGHSKSTPATIAVKLNEDLKVAEADAWTAVRAALKSKDNVQIEEAKDKIRAVKSKSAEFEAAALANHWTQEDVDRQMEVYALSDLYAETKPLNDQEDINKQDQGH